MYDEHILYVIMHFPHCYFLVTSLQWRYKDLLKK